MTQTKPSDHHEWQASALGSLLTSKRHAAGLSQHELAAQLGVSRPYLSHLEHGEYNPSPRILTRIAARLCLPIDDLYAITGYLMPQDLPSFGPYLRAKHPTWPKVVRQELEDYYQFIKDKHSLQ